MNKFKLICLILVLAALQGCANKVGTRGLVPNSVVENTIRVEASQGAISVASSLPSQMYMVEADDYKEGIANALAAAGVFSGGAKKYDLRADILTLDYPAVGFTMEATYVVKYTVSDETGRVVGCETLTSKGTCPMSENFFGGVRVHRAITRAIESQYPLMIDYVAQTVSNDMTHVPKQ